MIKIIKQILRIIYALSFINFFKFFKFYNSNSINIVLLTKHWNKPAIEPLFWELATIRYFINNKIYFSCSFSRDYNSFKNKKIFWYPGAHFFKNSINFSKRLIDFALAVEKNENDIHPSSHQISFLENKSFMYKEFLKHEISHPKTFIIEKKFFDKSNPFSFPFLFKGEHGNSGKEVVLISNDGEWLDFLNSKLYKSSKQLIFQKLVDMRFDIRVVVVGSEIVNHYWRVNPESKWQPTSTDFGSFLEFKPLPNNVISESVTNLKKLGLDIGAYDITFEKNDVESQPLFLEVSPLFSLNPMVNGDVIKDYSKFKKAIFGKNVFWKSQIDEIFKISNIYLRKLKINNI